MNKEDVVHSYNGILLSCLKEKIESFVETWMDLESVMWEHVCGALPSRMDGDVFCSDWRTPWVSCFLACYGYLKC